MNGLVSRSRGVVASSWAWLPTTVDRRVRFWAWASLVAQILIVGTGGAVRLTGSGLGCPTWPQCTPGSYVALPEQGIHGVIEFGNRLLTFVLVIIAIAAFLHVLRMRARRPDLFRLTLVLGLGIPAQAVLGGLTVLTGLNPYLVGAHFLLSAVLVALATIFVVRVRFGQRRHSRVAPLPYRIAVYVCSLLVVISVVIGVLTTGSGPHAGDAETPRNGLDPAILQHLHSYPGYALLAITVALFVSARVLRLDRLQKYIAGLLAVEIAQIVVGIAQARLGLPEILVGIHMVLACVLIAAMTAVVAALRLPDDVEATPIAVPDERLQRV